MRLDVFVKEGDVDADYTRMVEIISTGQLTLTIGGYWEGLTLFMSPEQARIIANRILDALREADEVAS